MRISRSVTASIWRSPWSSRGRVNSAKWPCPRRFSSPSSCARRRRRSPRSWWKRSAPSMAWPSMEVAGNGYINIRLDRGAYAALLRGEGEGGEGSGEKIIVEHTNINPNKAAHIGHLRNATLGDTFVRMLRARGHQVEVQNYIDNTGVQVADVVVGFHYLEHKTPADVRAHAGRPGGAVRLLLLGPVRAHVELLQGPSRVAGMAHRDAACDRERRGRGGGTGAPGGRRHRGGASGDHAAAGRGVRRAAARERDSAPAVLGGGVRAAEAERRPSTSRPKASWRAAG